MERGRDGCSTVGAKAAAIVVSDVLIYREGIAAGLTRMGDFQVVAAVGSEELAATLRNLTPKLIFLDISNPRSRSCARTARQVACDLHIIGFGMTSEDEGLAGAEAGVTAFVDHDGTIDDLNQAALDAMDGFAVCPPGLTTRLLQRIAQLSEAPRAQSSESLTQRERQIASLVEDGLSNKEIAITLAISPATVKNHVHTILDKLNIRRRGMIVGGLSRISKRPVERV